MQTEIKVRSTLALRRVQNFGQNLKNSQAFYLLHVCFVGDYIKMSFFQNFYVCHYFSSSYSFIYKHCIKYALYTALLRRAGPHSCLHSTLLGGEEPQVPKHCWVTQPPFFVSSEMPIVVNLFEGGWKGITGPTSPSFWHWSIFNSFK